MTGKPDTSTKNAHTSDGSGDLPPDQAKPVDKDNPDHEDAHMTEPEYKRTLNPFRKGFWEAGHEPGDEILPQLKWLAIVTAITVLVGIFGVLLGY